MEECRSLLCRNDAQRAEKSIFHEVKKEDKMPPSGVFRNKVGCPCYEYRCGVWIATSSSLEARAIIAGTTIHRAG